MLQKIRENSQGWIAWAIVGLIIVTFALFGIDQYAQSERTIIVAEVNGDDITGTEFLILYNRQKQRLQSQFGDMYDQVVNDETLRTKVLNALIESKVMQQYASDSNMTVSNQQLSSIIQSTDIFHKDGKFDEETYNSILLRNGLSVAGYEYEQRKFLAESQYKDITASSVFATQTELTRLAKLQFQQRKFNYLRIDQSPIKKMQKVTEQQITYFYNKNKLDFIVPEQVSVDYLLLSQKDIAAKVAVNEEVLNNYYQENQDQFTFVEQREASHILVRVDHPNLDGAGLKKITDIEEKIKAGVSFKKLAKEFSEDPASAAKNGALGKFQQGMMVPEFDKAVFSLEEGQVSEIVKTDFGYHIIKLTKIHPMYFKKYAEVKKEVEENYREREAEQQYFNLLEELNTLTYEQPDTLKSASSAIGVEIKTTKMFSKTGLEEGVPSNSKFVTASFAEGVKNGKVNSSVIELSPTSSVVLRVNQVVEAKQKDISEVFVEIEKTIKKQAGKKGSADLASGILAKVKSGESLKSFVKKGVEYKTKGWIERENNRVLPQLTSAIFKAPKPTENNFSYVTAVLPLGDSVVIEIVAIKEGQMPTDLDVTKTLVNAAELIQVESEVAARINALLASADIDRKESYKTLK